LLSEFSSLYEYAEKANSEPQICSRQQFADGKGSNNIEKYAQKGLGSILPGSYLAI